MKSRYLALLSLVWLTQAQAEVLLPDSAVRSYECDICDALSHDTLNLSWNMADKALGHQTMRQQKSLKYRIKITAGELKKGVAVYTTAPQAIIRISPVNPKTTIMPSFQIKKEGGNYLTLKNASALFSRDEALQDTAFAGQDLMLLQLKPELGFGKFILADAQATQDEQSEFYIHIFDRYSSTYLNVETDKASYSFGDQLTATIMLKDDMLSYPIDSITASLISPAGESLPLTLQRIKPDLYEAKTTLLTDKNSQGENWYIETEITSYLPEQTIKRHAHTAFSYVIPSAAIREIKRTSQNSFDFTAKLEIACGSRYALQAVLYGSDKEGKMHSMQTIQTAAWLPIGEQTISFAFNKDKMAHYKPPYYLGYIHLIDYGQLKPVFEYNEPVELSKLG